MEIETRTTEEIKKSTELLIRAYQPDNIKFLESSIRHYFKNPDKGTIEDIMQEACMRLYRLGHKFNGETNASFKGYIATIARHICDERIERKGTKIRNGEVDYDEEQALYVSSPTTGAFNVGADPLDKFSIEQAAQIIHDLLNEAETDTRDRDINIWLHIKFTGDTYKQTANVFTEENAKDFENGDAETMEEVTPRMVLRAVTKINKLITAYLESRGISPDAFIEFTSQGRVRPHGPEHKVA